MHAKILKWYETFLRRKHSKDSTEILLNFPKSKPLKRKLRLENIMERRFLWEIFAAHLSIGLVKLSSFPETPDTVVFFWLGGGGANIESPYCVGFLRSAANQQPATARAICIVSLAGVPWTLIGWVIGKPSKICSRSIPGLKRWTLLVIVPVVLLKQT